MMHLMHARSVQRNRHSFTKTWYQAEHLCTLSSFLFLTSSPSKLYAEGFLCMRWFPSQTPQTFPAIAPRRTPFDFPYLMVSSELGVSYPRQTMVPRSLQPIQRDSISSCRDIFVLQDRAKSLPSSKRPVYRSQG